jgi:hypothetical protein
LSTEHQHGFADGLAPGQFAQFANPETPGPNASTVAATSARRA